MNPLDKDAACWCLIGSAMYCYPNYDDRKPIYDKLAAGLGNLDGWSSCETLISFNDDRATFEQVRGLVERIDL